jgi:hypothetical protein
VLVSLPPPLRLARKSAPLGAKDQRSDDAVEHEQSEETDADGDGIKAIDAGKECAHGITLK